jgi:hypothetical protein
VFEKESVTMDDRRLIALFARSGIDLHKMNSYPYSGKRFMLGSFDLDE